ncbi:MAG: repair protein RadC [Mucilaginibacter sp.]|nr:repair protein RadC [Mucilaginibacter sp.]
MEMQNMLQCAEIQLTYRPVIKAQHSPKVATGRQTYELLLSSWDKGNIQPSEQGLNMTRRIKEAGKVLDIHVLDHIIITTDSYYSFADEGIL